MSLGREQLVGIAHAERQRLGRTIQYTEPESWDRPSAAEGWWNRDVMAHLAAQDTAAAQVIAGEPAQEMEEYRSQLGESEPFTVDAFNAWTVARRSGLDTREILSTWGLAAESLLAHAALLSQEDWTELRLPWLAGPIAPRYLIQSRVVEWWLHGEDMRATNGLGPQIQHWPVWLTIDLGVRMLPWALARAGFDLSGRTIRVEVEGAGEGSWSWGLGAGEVPSRSSEPDAEIKGRAVQLALIAGRRVPAHEALASGNIVVSGDRRLGEIVVSEIRAFP